MSPRRMAATAATAVNSLDSLGSAAQATLNGTAVEPAAATDRIDDFFKNSRRPRLVSIVVPPQVGDPFNASAASG